MRNRTSDFRILRSDALPLSLRPSDSALRCSEPQRPHSEQVLLRISQDTRHMCNVRWLMKWISTCEDHFVFWLNYLLHFNLLLLSNLSWAVLFLVMLMYAAETRDKRQFFGDRVYSKYQRQSSMTVIVKQISSRSICLVHGISISSRVFSKIYFVLHCSFRLIFDRNVNTKLFEYFAGNAPTKISYQREFA